MKKLYLLIILMLFASSGFLQADPPGKFSKIKIIIENEAERDKLIHSGLLDPCSSEITDGQILTIAGEYELSLLSRMGCEYSVLINDMQQYYEQRLKDYNRKNHENFLLDDEIFEYGSMGGFFTLSEIYEQFDRMLAKYPEYFIDYAIIGYTYENRPVYAYTISDGDEEKPQVLFTAVHHAREPGGASVLIYFLNNLLKKADAGDPESTGLLKKRKICVIPCLNPDGYAYNQENAPDGGGMWRKNRKKINDTTFGVDLNRNYGPQHYWDGPAAEFAKDPRTNTYRGDKPFSENETQAVRDFVNRKDFNLVLNYHTHGSYLINPFGYVQKETSDSIKFRLLSETLTKINRYYYGTSDRTVGYPISGGSDDWMYYSDEENQRVISMTPEVGTGDDGFWPSRERIIEQVRENYYMNLQAAWSAGANIRLTDNYYEFSNDDNNSVHMKFLNAGIEDHPEDITIQLKSLTPGIYISNSTQVIHGLESIELDDLVFDLKFPGPFSNGTEAEFELTILQENTPRKDTISMFLYKPKKIVLFGDESDIDKWQSDKWGVQKDASSEEFLLTDSPDKDYEKGIDNPITLKNSLDLSAFSAAGLEFETMTDSEKKYDFGSISISAEGSDWQDLKSDAMTSIIIRKESPNEEFTGFSGFAPVWKRQRISLNEYLKQDVKFRFLFLSDNSKNYDGWFLKNIVVKTYDIAVPVDSEDETGINVYPQPLQKEQKLTIESGYQGIKSVKIFDSLGKLIIEDNFSDNKISFPANIFRSGLFFIKLENENTEVVRKLIVY